MNLDIFSRLICRKQKHNEDDDIYYENIYENDYENMYDDKLFLIHPQYLPLDNTNKVYHVTSEKNIEEYTNINFYNQDDDNNKTPRKIEDPLKSEFVCYSCQFLNELLIDLCKYINSTLIKDK